MVMYAKILKVSSNINKNVLHNPYQSNSDCIYKVYVCVRERVVML